MRKSRLDFLKRIQWREVFLVLLAALVLVLGGVLYGNRYLERSHARVILSEAKNVQLTFRLLATEFYGTNTSMRDDSRESGLTESVEQKVLEIPQMTGQVEALGWSDWATYPTSFLYQNGEYAVIYTSTSFEDSTWQVYHARKLLDLNS